MRELPTTINVQGVDLPIVTDFRVVLVWHYYVTRTVFLREDDNSKAILLVCMLCLEPPKTPEGMTEALRELAEFLVCGDDPGAQGELEAPCIDFHQDRNRIWAAFRRCYGMDLDKERLHWWDFRSLLNELPEDTEIKQLMRLRADKPKFPGQDATPDQLSQYWEAVETRERYKINWTT